MGRLAAGAQPSGLDAETEEAGWAEAGAARGRRATGSEVT